MPIFARLKPHQPRQGFPLLSCNFQSMHFDAGGPAREVTAKQADFLQAYHETETDPSSPLAFEVWTGTAEGPGVAAPKAPSPPPAPSPVAPRATPPGPITTAEVNPPKPAPPTPPPAEASAPPPQVHVPLPPAPPPVDDASPEFPEDPAVTAAREKAEEANRRLMAARFPTKQKTNRYRKP
jgi:hypothetical protein